MDQVTYRWKAKTNFTVGKTAGSERAFKERVLERAKHNTHISLMKIAISTVHFHRIIKKVFRKS